MKKIKVKRVFLIDENYKNVIVIPQDFFNTLSDQAILDFLYEVGKDIWIGQNMYHITQQNGQIRHLRYEIHTVTQYEKSWYNLLFDALRRL